MSIKIKINLYENDAPRSSKTKLGLVKFVRYIFANIYWQIHIWIYVCMNVSQLLCSDVFVID